MNVLALEAYYGGSHQAFLDGWRGVSDHNWDLLTLPAHKWKWRMRHSAVSFADEVAAMVAAGRGDWDMVFATDMVNLAEFLGLSRSHVGHIPTVLYFHENQLTYPVRFESERDYQFAVTNMTSALAATQVWFNSAFHRDEFLAALAALLRKMPDCQPIDAIERIRDKSRVQSQGIDPPLHRGPRRPGPLRILWAARWEHDKGAEDFFEALKQLKARSVEFRVSVIGEQFRDRPAVFDWARHYFEAEIDRWGYQQSRADYQQALAEADVFVSTASHEFFGISCVEACAAGAYPLVPTRLAYPEILGLDEDESVERFFYDGTVAALADKLADLARAVEQGRLWEGEPDKAIRLVERFTWPNHAPVLDNALSEVARL